jgi:hypothetical protein
MDVQQIIEEVNKSGIFVVERLPQEQATSGR